MTVKECLTSTLNMEFELLAKTWQLHWNVTGTNFLPLHAFFGDNYTHLVEVVDDVAERLRQLGEVALHPALPIDANFPLDAAGMTNRVEVAHKALSKKLISTFIPACEKASDYGTMDMLIKIAQWHDKQAWIAKSLAG
jgi:starvation-inducible DNA-binding protein